MKIGTSLLAAIAVCGVGLATKPASAQAAGPANGLAWTMQSLEDLRDESRANAGYRKARWVCQQPSGPCVWQPGYWGPPPAATPTGPYVYVRPFGGEGWSYPLN